MFATISHVNDLRAEIARLERMLEQERAEKRELLDRLLQKNNIAPTSAASVQPVAPVMEVISPFGSAATPEMVDSLRESWIAEEAAYLQFEQNMPTDQAQAIAEQHWAKGNIL